MIEWDAVALEHLDVAVGQMLASGFTNVAREEIRQLWRANCERFEPEQLFDDASTLGFTAARNVLNGLQQAVRIESIASTSVDEFSVPVFRVNEFNVRVFKTSGSIGRSPRMLADFDWRGRESRHAAAMRNDVYKAPKTIQGATPLFEIPRPDAESQVRLCHDVFLFWGGNSGTGLTAGWAGLPTVGKSAWLAVRSLWWDDAQPETTSMSSDARPDAGAGLGGRPIPNPILRLKKRSSQVEA